jgi:micrococcal nuclease
MTSLSTDDYPATWGGVLLCCTYTGIITGRFLSEALLCPLLRGLSTSCLVVAGFVRAYPAVFMVPMVLLWKLFATARRGWRNLTWRHQTLYILGGLIYGLSCAFRLVLWLLSWVEHWPWWFVLDKCVLYMATLLPVAVPSALATGRLMSRLGLRALLTIRNMGDKPVVLPIIRRSLPKVWIWWAHVQLARFYRARLPRQLLQCCACYFLLVSSGMVNTLPMVNAPHIALTYFRYTLIKDVSVWQTPGSTHMPHHAEDAHITRCSTSNTPRFIPDVQRGKVTAVYDGDTLTVAARHGRQGIPYRFSVRLSGIDAPEIHGAASAGEKRAAIVARDALRTAILGELVTLTVYSFDKYGRLLASLAHDEKGDISNWMLETGHARPYVGGKREAWEVRV